MSESKRNLLVVLPPNSPPNSAENAGCPGDLEAKLAQKTINEHLVKGLESASMKEPSKVAKYFLSQYADRVVLSDEGEPVFNEADGRTTPLSEYLGTWAKAEGSMFVPAVQAPSSDGLKGGAPKAPLASTSQYRNMSFEQVEGRRQADPEGYRAYISQHRDEYTRKRREYERSQ